MTTVRQIAEMNNTGAAKLVADHDTDAFDVLQRALRIMESQMQDSPDNDASSSSTSTSPQDSPTNSKGDNMSESSAARFLTDTKNSTEISALRDGHFSIFNHSLIVDTENQSIENVDFSNCSQAMVCFYTSVIIFNLALAYHKKGMAGVQKLLPADHTRLALSQSLRLYEHCLKVVRTIADYSEDCKMLMYACSYNLAHLYCRKGERSRAQQLLDGLEPLGHFHGK